MAADGQVRPCAGVQLLGGGQLVSLGLFEVWSCRELTVVQELYAVAFYCYDVFIGQVRWILIDDLPGRCNVTTLGGGRSTSRVIVIVGLTVMLLPIISQNLG